MANKEEIGKLVSLYLKDNDFYAKTFFPNLARQESAPFHHTLDKKLWGGSRFISIKMFRDSGKTSRLRLFISKRVAYGYSRTGLYVSKSQAMAIRSISWIKKEIETNEKWTSFYGLKQGSKWTNEEIEIYHSGLDISISFIAVGITGQVRGTNEGGYRPDLIVCDDVDDESTVTTPEQIHKTREVFFGGLANSLAPRSENLHSLMVLAQTPLSANDLVSACGEDPEWDSMKVSVFSEDKEGNVESSWPARYPLETLLEAKEFARQRGMLSGWMREKEVTVINKETAPLSPENVIKHLDYVGLKFEKLCISIDPASSDTVKADFQAVALGGLLKNNFYLLAYKETKGEDVESSAEALFDLILTCRNIFNTNPEVVVEKTGYQKVLAKFLVKQQAKRGIYFLVTTVDDKRKKEDRIIQALAPVINAGAFHCLESHKKFLTDIEVFPAGKHDDLPDAVSVNVDKLIGLSNQNIVSISKERPKAGMYALPALSVKRRIVPQRLIRHV